MNCVVHLKTISFHVVLYLVQNLKKKIYIYRFFFPLEVQVTRKGNMQQRRVLRTVSSQTWKRHLFSESFLPTWPLPCMMVKSMKLTRLRVKFARVTWRKLSRSNITYYFTIFFSNFDMLNFERLIIIYTWIYYFFSTNYILPHYNYDKILWKILSAWIFLQETLGKIFIN